MLVTGTSLHRDADAFTQMESFGGPKAKMCEVTILILFHSSNRPMGNPRLKVSESG